MSDDTTENSPNGVRFRRPTVETADESEGHRWEPHSQEHDELLATPPPPPKRRDDVDDDRT